jgi:hypothetical protein
MMSRYFGIIRVLLSTEGIVAVSHYIEKIEKMAVGFGIS